MTRYNHHRKNRNNNPTSSNSIQTTSYFQVLDTINEDGSKKEETHHVQEQPHSPESTHLDSNTSGSGLPVNESQDDTELQQNSTRLDSNTAGSESSVVQSQEDTELQHSTHLDSNSSGSEVPVVQSQEDTQQPHSTPLDSNSSGSEVPVVQSLEDVNNSSLLHSSSQDYVFPTNCLVPRPVFLKFKPDKHPAIIDRCVELARRSRSSHGTWSLNVLLKYLFALVGVILITLCISLMNSPRVRTTESIHGFNGSVTEGEEFDFMMLMRGYLSDRKIDKGYKKRDQEDLRVSTKEPVVMHHEKQEGYEVGDVEAVETAKKNEIEPVILVSEKMETLRVEDEIDVYVQLLGNLDTGGVNQESEILKPVMDENDGNKKRDENDLTVSTKELVAMQHEQHKDDELEDSETVETDEKITNEWIEPENLIREKPETFRVEDEIKVCIQLLGNLDSNLGSSHVNQESEILKPMMHEDNGNKSVNENTNSVTKLAYLDPLFAAFSAIAVVIIASTSVLYCSMQTEVSSPIDPINEAFDETSSVVSFCSKSSIYSECHERNQEACSSNQTKYFDLQQSTADSPSHGSFTVENKIVKKQRNETPEAVISTVRRSSRLHNRSISSP